MALAFVQRAISPRNTASTLTSANFGSSVTSGSLLVVLIQAQSGGAAVSSITDSVGGGTNTYTVTAGSPSNSGGANYQYIAYAKNVTGGASFNVTVTWGSAFAYFCFAVYEISGADTTAPFVTDSTGSGSSTAATTGTLTLTGNSIICAIAEADAKGFVAGTGYTLFQTDDLGFISDEYHITGSSEAAAMTVGSGNWGIMGAAFKEAGGGGGGGKPASYYMQQRNQGAS